MKYCLYFDPSHSREWQLQLIQRLSEMSGAKALSCRSNAIQYPFHIERFLQFEKVFILGNVSGLASRVEPEAIEAVASPLCEEDDCDLVIDLVGDGNAPAAKASVTLLFDGVPGEKSLITSIMHKGMPQVALRDEKSSIVATAHPSSELAKGVNGSMDQAYARVITLMLAWIRHPHRWVQPLQTRPRDWSSAGAVLTEMIRLFLTSSIKSVYYRLFLPSHWRIGWRWVSDKDVWSRQSLDGEPWQVLPDENDHFYADPVPWQKDGTHYLFFEDLDHKSQKGILCVVTFDENGHPGPVQPCLEEPFHLSYPFLIEHEGEVYMLPETSADRKVTLYKASNFPLGWQPFKTILSDIDVADATITRHDNRWWLFCVTRDGGGYSDCLSIFYADDLFGSWHAHAQNPVLIDRARARPAGNFVYHDGKLCRPVQDCTASYGGSLPLIEVTHLSPEHYEQKTLKHLLPNERWPGRKLHTLNRAGNLEVIDGAILRPRWAFLKKLVDRKYSPASDNND
nr:hypothetical protein [uncultured Cohaesibacter sp.]